VSVEARLTAALVRIRPDPEFAHGGFALALFRVEPQPGFLQGDPGEVGSQLRRDGRVLRERPFGLHGIVGPDRIRHGLRDRRGDLLRTVARDGFHDLREQIGRNCNERVHRFPLCRAAQR
jgi:hypothetical protein